MTDYYHRTYFQKEGEYESLDHISPPVVGHVFENFFKTVESKYNEGYVVLFATVTIHPKMKDSSGRLVWDASPERQYNAIHEKLSNAMKKYFKNYKTSTMSYWFYETTKAGKIHAHGLFCHAEDTTAYYPIFIGQLKSVLVKVGFSSYGVNVQYPKILGNVATYIKKDYGKHRMTPQYILQ